MWAQLQVKGNQLVDFVHMIDLSGVKVLIYHCAPYPLKTTRGMSNFWCIALV